MGFEEEFFELMKTRAEALKKYYKELYGEEDEMTEEARKLYEEEYKDSTEVAVKRFHDRLNCGGYALEIDNTFYPNGEEFSNYISSILDTFDFVRLLGDEPLQDDEYLVFYRFIDYDENNGQNKGHHFIKVEDDGLVVEKNGREKPRIFTQWHERYSTSPEAVFAVKKNHDHYFDSKKSLTRFSGGLNFEQSVSKALEEHSNSFSYHSHDYELKKDKNGNIVVTDKHGDIVANITVKGDENIVDIAEGKEDYVENLTGPVKPIIENGRLVNFKQFKRSKEKEDER